MAELQAELVHLQAWVKREGAKVCVVFEGRDGAGKGGVIKRIAERVSPREFRVIALPAPTDREKTQMYVQRYLPHFPAGGEVVIFDRSWYNRAGVERVMGFCTQDEAERFLEATDSPWAPWYVVDANNKRRARLNVISHLLDHVPYERVPTPKVSLPSRQKAHGYVEPPLLVDRVPARS